MTWIVAAAALVIALIAVALAARERRASDLEHRHGAALERSVEELGARVQSLDEERRAMEMVLSSMEEGILLFGADGGVRVANAAASRHLRLRPTSLAALLPLALEQAARRAAEERTTVAVEVETGAPSRWLRASAIPVGHEGSVLLVVRDVTQPKRVEAIRRDFVANASHELKTPAASIQATAETIKTAVSDDPEVVARFADQLEREATRLSRIVSDLLDLSRLESGGSLDELVAIDRLLREEAERFEEAAAEAQVALSVRAEVTPPVRGSARDLSLLVRNLVDNAIRYTRPGGRVDVAVFAEEGGVLLKVADTGMGIPSRDLSRIFERFYRVDRARSRETGGTGLGLSIVKHIVENHGGTIKVDSELGQGTTFLVRLQAEAVG
jgi:two-component system phosphate regulon sensor histidine kinase PhoR